MKTDMAENELSDLVHHVRAGFGSDAGVVMAQFVPNGPTRLRVESVVARKTFEVEIPAWPPVIRWHVRNSEDELHRVYRWDTSCARKLWAFVNAWRGQR